ncbi:MAG: hypothetical protein WDW38_011582 [Sanguina aurantia]
MAHRLEVLVRQLTAAGDSVWEHIEQAPPDAIIGITEAFKACTDPRRLNLGVGAYRTEEGAPLVLTVVKKAEQAILADPAANHEYLPIDGHPAFRALSRALAFGADSPGVKEKRIATVQALSGTGALRLGAEFLAQHYKGGRTVYIPNPSWGNHRTIFAKAGLTIKEYRYWKPSTRGLDYEGMIEDLEAAPLGSVVVMHVCAHNPTGVDPTQAQWRGILAVTQRRKLLPFFDSAYQGFASGCLDKDAFALRLFADTGLELLLAQSYAKNMGLYGERIGALSVTTKCPQVAIKIESQLKQVARPMYSNPPLHGALIAAKVLGDKALFEEWKVELKGMADRITAMRKALTAALSAQKVPGDWSFITSQIGMFSYLGLTKKQVERMTGKWFVFMTLDGRISMAGLSAAKCPYLATAIADCVANA